MCASINLSIYACRYHRPFSTLWPLWFFDNLLLWMFHHLLFASIWIHQFCYPSFSLNSILHPLTSLLLLMLFYLILSYLLLSYAFLSYSFLSCLVLSCLVLSYAFLSSYYSLRCLHLLYLIYFLISSTHTLFYLFK